MESPATKAAGCGTIKQSQIGRLIKPLTRGVRITSLIAAAPTLIRSRDRSRLSIAVPMNYLITRPPEPAGPPSSHGTESRTRHVLSRPCAVVQSFALRVRQPTPAGPHSPLDVPRSHPERGRLGSGRVLSIPLLADLAGPSLDLRLRARPYLTRKKVPPADSSGELIRKRL